MKIPMVAVVLLIIFSGISTYSIWNTIILSLLVIAVSYIAGDLFILKMTNNTIATLSDFGVVLLMVWLAAIPVFGAGVPFGLAFISAVIIASGEWGFHKYMNRVVLPDMYNPYPS
ncbi:DUF2512 family protein [Alteribacillus bidgolensis]|nr:DUF2512 family protein [Alteribacillus bidgolensis]